MSRRGLKHSRLISVAAAVVLALGGCGSDSEPTAPVLSDQHPGLVPASELPENAVENAVAQLDSMATDLMEKSGIPGLAVAVVHGGETLYAKGFGVRDVRTGDAVDPDTVFQLASLSKSLGATVVAKQVGENIISWDTPLVTELPWFALKDPVVTEAVTVGDMYSHRSGLPSHSGDLLEDLGYDRRYVLERLSLLPLTPFRIYYDYTNFGVTAAAEAVAAAAGKPWEDLSEQVLYGPLGMASTSSKFSDYEARTNRAVGHIRLGDRYEPDYVRDADVQSPAGGASSSVNDMARWLAMVLADGSYAGRQIVDSDALLPALTPQIVAHRATEPAMRSGFYGYGFNVGSTSGARMEFSHSGAFQLGAGTNFAILPSADVAIIALTNATPSGVAETLNAQFMDLVQFGEIRQDWYSGYRRQLMSTSTPVGSLAGQQPPATPLPARPLGEYVGTYANDYWGPAVVTVEDQGLTLALGPRDTFRLRHWDGDVFSFNLISENAPPGSVSKVTFTGDTVNLEYFDQVGLGTFTREPPA